jgi:hypothetical protein
MKLPFFLLLTFFCSVNPASVASEPLIMPISGASALEVINQYEAPLTEYGAGHRGIDLEAPIGTEVIAPVSGEISFSGQVGYRESITIMFGNSLKASLEPVCSELIEGTRVLAGEVIGNVCEPDISYQWHCEFTCLHFGSRTDTGYFSPLALLGVLAPSRLVPLGDQALG